MPGPGLWNLITQRQALVHIRLGHLPAKQTMRTVLAGSPDFQGHHGLTPRRPIHRRPNEFPKQDAGDTHESGALQLPPQHINWQNF